MRRVQVITQKEMVYPEELKDCTVVVIDVFLATSTIVFLLQHDYEPVYAMKDIKSAKQFSSKLSVDHIKLGEIKGEPVEGFLYPDPTVIQKGKCKTPAIICSTNGTRAIERASQSKRLYISSIINGHAIAERLHQQTDGSSIVIICSGNNDRFSMEDFVGAGQLIDHLTEKGNYDLSDSAKVSQNTFLHSKSAGFKDLLAGRTADLLRSYEFPESMDLVIEKFEQVDVIPVFKDEKIVLETEPLEID